MDNNKNPTPAQIAAEMNRIMDDRLTLTEIRNLAEYNLTMPDKAESEKEMKDLTLVEATVYDNITEQNGRGEVLDALRDLATRVAELEAALTNIVKNVDMGDFIITVAGTYDEPEHPANLDFARRLLAKRTEAKE